MLHEIVLERQTKAILSIVKKSSHRTKQSLNRQIASLFLVLCTDFYIHVYLILHKYTYRSYARIAWQRFQSNSGSHSVHLQSGERLSFSICLSQSKYSRLYTAHNKFSAKPTGENMNEQEGKYFKHPHLSHTYIICTYALL